MHYHLLSPRIMSLTFAYCVVADRRTASFLLAVILAGMLLDFVGSAAIRDTPFWKDACSVTAKTRHGRSATNSIVQSQLNHAISKINTLMKKNLPAMFPKVSTHIITSRSQHIYNIVTQFQNQWKQRWLTLLFNLFQGQYPKSSTNNNPNCINTIKFLKQMRRNKTQVRYIYTTTRQFLRFLLTFQTISTIFVSFHCRLWAFSTRTSSGTQGQSTT